MHALCETAREESSALYFVVGNRFARNAQKGMNEWTTSEQ